MGNSIFWDWNSKLGIGNSKHGIGNIKLGIGIPNMELEIPNMELEIPNSRSTWSPRKVPGCFNHPVV
jgi:hypothetical protein